MQVGLRLGHGHIVLGGVPQKVHRPQFSAHIYCSQMAGWIKMPLCMEVGLDPSNIVLDGAQLPLHKKVAEPPNFQPMLYWGEQDG